MDNIDISDQRKHLYCSPAMQDVMRDVDLFAPTDMPILITGANGTGKENIARLVHTRGKRADKEFLAINCAAISPGLIESELFGHEKGSFTGASGKRVGAFEAAKDGTIFLDEIGEMPAEMQTKLLRVLQDGEFCRVGGQEKITARPRIVAATNRNVEEAVASGKLREDLYYRLRGAQISLPDLKDRPSDIPLLAQHFLTKTVEKYGLNPVTVSDAAHAQLMEYAWPGNVRELENRMGEAAMRAQVEGGIITPAILRLKTKPALPLDNNQSPLEESFGFRLAQHREARGWTQSQLADKVSHKSQTHYHDADIHAWESNKELPEREVINTLAYLLILNSPEKMHFEKMHDLREFYEKADTRRNAATVTSEDCDKGSFGELVRKTREMLGLDQSEFASLINQLKYAEKTDWKQIYMIENNHPDAEVTPRNVLCMVKALDREDQPLTTQEKVDLYESAKRDMMRKDARIRAGMAAQNDNQPDDKDKLQLPVDVRTAVPNLQEQRAKLASFFTDRAGRYVNMADIAEGAKLRPQVLAALMGRSRLHPTKVTHCLEEQTLTKLCAYLQETLGKEEPTVEEFKREFQNMRSICGVDATGKPTGASYQWAGTPAH